MSHLGFFGDVTVITMLPPDNRQMKSGLLDDVMEDHLCHIWVTTDVTVTMVILAAGQDMWHRLRGHLIGPGHASMHEEDLNLSTLSLWYSLNQLN